MSATLHSIKTLSIENITMLEVRFTNGGVITSFRVPIQSGLGEDLHETIFSLRHLAAQLEKIVAEFPQTPETEERPLDEWQPDYSNFPFANLSIQEIMVLVKESRPLGDDVFVKACMDHIKTRKPEKESP